LTFTVGGSSLLRAGEPSHGAEAALQRGPGGADTQMGVLYP
jgi:hypothetical protein